MSDFLTRIAQRAVGHVNGLEPVREPVFPADPAIDPALDASHAAAPPPTVPVATPTRERTARTTAIPASERPLAHPNQPANTARREAAAPTVSKPRARETRPAAERQAHISSPSLSERSTVQPRDVPSRITPSGHRTHSQRMPNSPPEKAAADATMGDSMGAAGVPAERATTQPSQRRRRDAGSTSSPPLRPPRTSIPKEAASAPAPVIVRIGRIDVRANIAPAPPAQAERKPTRTPALSLADYLERRNGGRR